MNPTGLRTTGSTAAAASPTGTDQVFLDLAVRLAVENVSGGGGRSGPSSCATGRWSPPV